MKIQLLLLTLWASAISAQPPGEFLHVTFLAGVIYDQMRVVTLPRPGYAPDLLNRPTVWKELGCESVDIDVWATVGGVGTCCEIPALEGFKIWEDKQAVSVSANEVIMDLYREPSNDLCHSNTEDLREPTYLPPGTYNSYIIQAYTIQPAGATATSDNRLRPAYDYLIEFHNQDIVGVVYTNGQYLFGPSPKDRDAFNNKIGKHLELSDPTFAIGGPATYPDRGELWRGIEVGQGGDAFSDAFEFYAINCDSRPACGSNGDPHFKTWSGEHYEYHGQCDMVLTKDNNFADGLGLDIHIRTKVVRFWSYIKNAVIRIGNDVLEVEGSANEEDSERHYWFNYEYQGELSTIGGFPIEFETRDGRSHRTSFEIDLSSKYPNQKIVISTYKEFIKVEINNPTKDSFGNAVGMMGNFATGATVGRDGVTILDDFTELGNEWQVLPADHLLFHESSEPQFPTKCLEPEDPRGERRRRLDESSISMEEAEAACASLKDPLTIKDCVYDILATQDLDMIGAF